MLASWESFRAENGLLVCRQTLLAIAPPSHVQILRPPNGRMTRRDCSAAGETQPILKLDVCHGPSCQGASFCPSGRSSRPLASCSKLDVKANELLQHIVESPVAAALIFRAAACWPEAYEKGRMFASAGPNLRCGCLLGNAICAGACYNAVFEAVEERFKGQVRTMGTMVRMSMSISMYRKHAKRKHFALSKAWHS